ncbi:MAG: hypothetical protein ACOC44_04455 [Promethearchaeia archaeon]
MNLEKLGKIFKVMGFIVSNPFCETPDIRKFLKIDHEPDLSKAERELYSILSKLEREGYIYKLPITRKGSGGAQFKIKLSEKGFGFLTQLKSQKILPEHFPTKEPERLNQDDPKEEGLEKVLNVFSSEVYDIIEETVETIIADILLIQFENFGFKNQTKVINAINESVKEIRDRAAQISHIFF